MRMGAPQIAHAEDEARAVLAFEDAVLPLEDDRTGLTVGFDLRLMPGDLALIDPADEAHERAVADAARGLNPARRGEVRFLGRSWAGLSTDHANALRGRIGHTFRRSGWVPYLSVMDNVMLGERYHTRRSATEIRDEGARLAAQFGLPGLPAGQPNEVSAPELQCAAHVSAFLGRPALLVLESPLGGLVPGLLAPLMNAIRGARDRHAAVLWFVSGHELRDDPRLPASHRLRLQGDAFVPTETKW
jgi:phospholipid/cholesterol/gamma-HCH transport system ATP-binding protein